MDAREDGVYITYSTGADTVTKNWVTWATHHIFRQNLHTEELRLNLMYPIVTRYYSPVGQVDLLSGLWEAMNQLM